MGANAWSRASGRLLLAVFSGRALAASPSGPLGRFGGADPVQNFEAWVKNRGYPLEVHNATTDDGYLLTVFRLPRAGAPPVLVQHGILDSAWGWVSNTEFKALGFQLHDAGYDVWLGNNRGNSFCERWANGSNAHKDHRFWNFTFDDMARFDVPAMIHTVWDETDHKKVAYVGHSQGTMQFFIASSIPELQPRVADRVSLFVALSPVAWVGNMKALLFQGLSRVPLAPVMDLFPDGFLDSSGWRSAAKALCTVTLGVVCKIDVDIVCGVSELDSPASITAYAEHFPYGTSFKDMIHFAQGVTHGTFGRYDYGASGNKAIYGQSTPPAYNLSNIMVPTALLAAEKDLLADRKDVDILVNAIGPTEKMVYFKSYQGFSHATWMLGSKQAGFYVADVLQLLKVWHSQGQLAPRQPLPPAALLV